MEHLKKFKLYNESFVHKNNSDDITELEDIFLPLSDMGLNILIEEGYPYKNDSYRINITKFKEEEIEIYSHDSVENWMIYIDKINTINNEMRSIIKRLQTKFQIREIIDCELNDDGEWTIPNIHINLTKK